MYKVLIERRAEKDLDTFDEHIKTAIRDRLVLLSVNPRTSDAKKLTGSKNAWRIRIGDWRAIYEIYDVRKEVKIYRIKHRSKIYKGQF